MIVLFADERNQVAKKVTVVMRKEDLELIIGGVEPDTSTGLSQQVI